MYIAPGSSPVSAAATRLEPATWQCWGHDASNRRAVPPLLAVPGLDISAEEQLERVWDESADPFSSAVKHAMHRLRAKLGDPPVIETIREGGYRIGPS
jgi:DNA-binding response OmpR family regulator